MAPHRFMMALVVVAVGCGPIGRPADDDTGAVTRPSASSSTAELTSSAVTTKKKAKATRVAWVPFGPASPGSPPPLGWYGALERRDCAGLRSRALGDSVGDEGPDRVRSLYLALSYACAAAVDSNKAAWEQATTTAASVDRSSDYGCLETAALGLLDRLIAAHRVAPDVPVRLRKGQGTACPFRVTGVAVLDDAGEPVAGPATGPVAGGTRVLVSGVGFIDLTAVRFGEVAVPLDSTELSPGGDSLIVTAPPAMAAGGVRVVVVGPAGEAASSEDGFTYSDDATNGGA